MLTAAIDWGAIVPIASALGAVVTILIAWRRLPSQTEQTIADAARNASEVLNSALATQNRRIAELEERLKRAEKAAAEVPTLLGEVARLRNALVGEQAARKALAAELEQSRDRERSLRRENGELRKKIARLERRVAELEA